MTDRPANQVWDAEVALANVDGYHEDLKELLHLWLGQGPRLLSDIQAAVAGGNTKALEMALHTVERVASGPGRVVSRLAGGGLESGHADRKSG